MLSESELKLIKEIEEKFGFVFLEKITDGNLCYINSNAVLRDEFKRSFTHQDLCFFMKSFGLNKIQIPESEMEFWASVKKSRNQ